MKRIFTELRATKFSFPSGWGTVDRSVAGAIQSIRSHDPAQDISELPPPTKYTQDAGDITVTADRPTQRCYRSDAEIMGLDLIGKLTAPIYRQIWLPNYAGPAFRSAIGIVDAAFNRPLVLSADNVVNIDPSVVLQPSTSEVMWRPTHCCVQTESPSRPARRPWSSPRNFALPSEPEQGTADSICGAGGTRWAEITVRVPKLKSHRRTLCCRTKRFIRRIFFCSV